MGIEASVKLRQIIQRVVGCANGSVTKQPVEGGLFCMLLNNAMNDVRIHDLLGKYPHFPIGETSSRHPYRIHHRSRQPVE
jgi:hypothetical protein